MKKPSTVSVRLRAIWGNHNPFATLVIPPTSTRRVESSMKKSTTKRCNPARVHTSTVKKSLATTCSQCLLRNSFRSSFGSAPGLARCRDASECWRSCHVPTRVPDWRVHLDAAVAPVSVFVRHPDHQCLDPRRDSRPSGHSVRTAVVLFGDQLPVPCHQGLGCDDFRDLSQQAPSQFLRLGRKPAALVIAESNSPAAD